MVTVLLFPGWSQGKRHYRKLSQSLSKAGVHLSLNTPAAMSNLTVLCQSSGCLWDWGIDGAKAVILLAPPYTKHHAFSKRELVRRFNARARNELYFQRKNKQLAQGTRLTARSFGKIAKEPRINRIQYNLVKANGFVDKVRVFAEAHPDTPIHIVRYRTDKWTEPGLRKAFAGLPNVKLEVRNGPHDDVLYNPQPYVQLIKELNK